VNALFQEEAMIPTALGLWMLLAGCVLGKIEIETMAAKASATMARLQQGAAACLEQEAKAGI
jgi:hypothetical protein